MRKIYNKYFILVKIFALTLGLLFLWYFIDMKDRYGMIWITVINIVLIENVAKEIINKLTK